MQRWHEEHHCLEVFQDTDLERELVRPQPKREETEHPQPKREELVRPQPKREEAERPQPKREEPVRPQPKRGEAERPQPKREEPVHPQPKRGASKAIVKRLKHGATLNSFQREKYFFHWILQAELLIQTGAPALQKTAAQLSPPLAGSEGWADLQSVFITNH
ncbi:UNVERIFIED_CONTAM: hypothetical protein FKN15_001987 [Acipenser sinensis]